MPRSAVLLLAILGLCAPCISVGTETHSAQVIVYGATPGGVCAAVAAAREGATVLLVEPSEHVGGVNTGGLGFSDSNQMKRTALRGLFEEFHQRIQADYTARGVTLPYDVAVKDQRPWTYEPHVAAAVFAAMLRESGVTVLTGQVLASAAKDGPRLSSFASARGDTFRAGVFVDATYEGDLMAAAGVPWTIGREARSVFQESLAGSRYPKKPMAISGFDPTGKLLPLLTAAEGTAEGEGDERVMVYSFRLCLTAKPENRVPFPEPAHYDPARFEAIRRYLAQEKNLGPLWDLYPLPGEKFDANNGIGKQFSMGLIGAGHAWCAATPAERARIWEEHRQYTLEFYQFMATDPAVPEAVRASVAKLGLCRDEFPAFAHWSPQLYVREGRRMEGAYVMTQADILTDGAKPDSIGVASFPIDSHDCQRVTRGPNVVINEGTIFPARDPVTKQGHAYQVPYRAINPEATACTNLLVPVALSCSHVAFCSLRVEPAWMMISQSAGIAAAMAAKTATPVQQLDYASLKARLLAQGQVLE